MTTTKISDRYSACDGWYGTVLLATPPGPNTRPLTQAEADPIDAASAEFCEIIRHVGADRFWDAVMRRSLDE